MGVTQTPEQWAPEPSELCLGFHHPWQDELLVVEKVHNGNQ